MTNLQLVNANEVELKNVKLERVTQSIIKKGNQISKNIYNIAKQLASVETDKLYEEDGFKNASDYAEKVLGIKKSFANTLVRAGKEYIEKDGTNLPIGESEKDFTISQLQEMMPLGDHDKVSHHVECGDITPDMSTKKIREVVKEIKNNETVTESESEKEEGESEEDFQSTGNSEDVLEPYETVLTQLEVDIVNMINLIGREETIDLINEFISKI